MILEDQKNRFFVVKNTSEVRVLRFFSPVLMLELSSHKEFPETHHER
jgi:hypothetical protein